MASSTKTCGTGANDASAGVEAWVDFTNITAQDDTPGTSDVFGFGDETQYLKATNFGFAIPGGATIDGVECIWRGQMSSGTGTVVEAKLVKGGTISGTDQSASETFSGGGYADVTIGSSSNLWGTTLSDSDVNGSTFGCVLRGNDGGGIDTYLIDVVKMTVHYTEASGLTYFFMSF